MSLLRPIAIFVFLLGCGSETPVPDYPFPTHRPLEETELAEYVSAGSEEELEEEEWDDGLDDEMGALDEGESNEPASEE